MSSSCFYLCSWSVLIVFTMSTLYNVFREQESMKVVSKISIINHIDATPIHGKNSAANSDKKGTFSSWHRRSTKNLWLTLYSMVRN